MGGNLEIGKKYLDPVEQLLGGILDRKWFCTIFPLVDVQLYAEISQSSRYQTKVTYDRYLGHPESIEGSLATGGVLNKSSEAVDID